MRKLLVILLALLPSLGVFAEDDAVLRLPKDMMGKPLLFGSRVVSVNRPWGKVFANGQRNAKPVVMRFETLPDSSWLILRPNRPRVNSPYSGLNRRGAVHPLSFRVLEETPDAYLLEVLPAFATYPRAVTAVPQKMLPGHAKEYEILGVRETDRYFQITGRYIYSDGLDVTAACYLVFLRETPLAARMVNPELAGYNFISLRMPGGTKRQLPHHWNLEPGDKLDFYVDRAFPEEWFPYIKEGLEDWNKAFRAIGLGDVINVMPAPDTLDTSSPLVNMVRFIDVPEANAKGDVLIDPRSGEILQADILWWKDVTKLMCNWRYVQTGAADPAARQFEYPLEMLGPMIRHAMCHEMGHVLGLSHNMGASWAYPADSLRSVSFTQKFGTAASVMDYARYNHLATADDVEAGVNLLPPRIGPYDYYAIALGYGKGDVEPGQYCYFAPFISAAISPDPSAQPETLGNDLLRSSAAGLSNCRALLELDGLTPLRTEVLKNQYYHYIWLSLSNIGGVTAGIPVSRKVCDKTVSFVMESLAKVPPQLADSGKQKRILEELEGNFLPKRIQDNCGERELKRYYRRLHCLQKKYDKLLTINTNYDQDNL